MSRVRPILALLLLLSATASTAAAETPARPDEPQQCGHEAQRCGDGSQQCGHEAQRCGDGSQLCGHEAQPCGDGSQQCGHEAQLDEPPADDDCEACACAAVFHLVAPGRLAGVSSLPPTARRSYFVEPAPLLSHDSSEVFHVPKSPLA
jgi:hypothetical protein